MRQFSPNLVLDFTLWILRYGEDTALGDYAVTKADLIDLHRNLSEKQYMFATEIDPAVVHVNLSIRCLHNKSAPQDGALNY
jgi:hypothetical protein